MNRMTYVAVTRTSVNMIHTQVKSIPQYQLNEKRKAGGNFGGYE